MCSSLGLLFKYRVFVKNWDFFQNFSSLTSPLQEYWAACTVNTRIALRTLEGELLQRGKGSSGFGKNTIFLKHPVGGFPNLKSINLPQH